MIRETRWGRERSRNVRMTGFPRTEEQKPLHGVDTQSSDPGVGTSVGQDPENAVGQRLEATAEQRPGLSETGMNRQGEIWCTWMRFPRRIIVLVFYARPLSQPAASSPPPCPRKGCRRRPPRPFSQIPSQPPFSRPQTSLPTSAAAASSENTTRSESAIP